MYKVFFEKGIVLLTGKQYQSPYPSYVFPFSNIPKLLFRLEKGEFEGLHFLASNPKRAWKHFLQFFDVVEAAGGIVRNKDNKILFIYRRGLWDLPKGKTEPGETFQHTALREVGEECGIRRLTIEKFIGETYHVFWENSRRKMKIVKWFSMYHPGGEQAAPQGVEGIEKVEWLDPEFVLQEGTTFPNIRYLLTRHFPGLRPEAEQGSKHPLQ